MSICFNLKWVTYFNIIVSIEVLGVIDLKYPIPGIFTIINYTNKFKRKTSQIVNSVQKWEWVIVIVCDEYQYGTLLNIEYEWKLTDKWKLFWSSNFCGSMWNVLEKFKLNDKIMTKISSYEKYDRIRLKK